MRSVSDDLRNFVNRFFSGGSTGTCTIRALEAGAGGDCLYHSFAAGLEKMLRGDPAAARHVLQKIPLQVFEDGKHAVVAFLRRLSADGMDAWAPETFLDYVVSRAMDEYFVDEWDPRALLNDCGFSCLLGCESVLAFGDAAEGDAGDATCRIVRTDPHHGGVREEHLVLVPQGHSCLAALKMRVKDQIMRLGNYHWGDSFDVRSLSDGLDVGVLMFCDELQDGRRQCLYNIGAQREDYPFWISLWWDPPMHFRLAQLACRAQGQSATVDASNTAFTSFWATDQLPNVLLQHYQSCNRLSN